MWYRELQPDILPKLSLKVIELRYYIIVYRAY